LTVRVRFEFPGGKQHIGCLYQDPEPRRELSTSHFQDTNPNPLLSPRIPSSPLPIARNRQVPLIPHTYQSLEAFRNQILSGHHSLESCSNSPFFNISVASTRSEDFTRPELGATGYPAVDIFDPSMTLEEAVNASRQNAQLSYLANSGRVSNPREFAGIGPPPLPTRPNTPITTSSRGHGGYFQHSLPRRELSTSHFQGTNPPATRRGWSWIRTTPHSPVDFLVD
jgi:hypothetical protein